MKWASVKNILLGMLVIMNAFVIGALTIKRISSEEIPPVITTAAVEALESSGILCNDALLPNKYITAKRLNVSFKSPAELSRMFFGSQLAFQTDGRTLIARRDGAELIIKDETFSYSTGAEPAEATEKQLRKALRQMGLNMKNGVYSSEYNIFCCYYDNIPIFGMYIRAYLDSDGELCSIEARWPELSSQGISDTGITVINYLPYFGEAFPGGGTVESIRFGYYLSQNTATGQYELSPAWKVTMEDGRRHVFK